MKLLIKYFKLHLRLALEYKSSFILTTIAQSINVIAELFVLYCLFNKFKLLEEYNVYELLLAFSVLWLGSGIMEVIFRGWDHFSNLIIRGELDILLIRPRSLFLTITGTEIAYEKLSIILVSLVLLIFSFIKAVKIITLSKIILTIICVMAATTLYLSLFIISAAMCFKTIQGLEFMNVFTYGSRQLGQYPIDMFGKVIKKIFTYVIPITLINYYPLKFILGYTNNYIYFLIPFGVLILLVISVLLFRIGLKSYQGTGS